MPHIYNFSLKFVFEVYFVDSSSGKYLCSAWYLTLCKDSYSDDLTLNPYIESTYFILLIRLDKP